MKVDYIHHCGDDLTVANAARVSFHKHHDEFLKNDEGLIKFLAKHKHFSPFNHCFVTLRVKAPIFVARQLVKHEYMPWNEVSRRYVDEDPEFYYPMYWRNRAKDKKQGSGITFSFNDCRKINKWVGRFNRLSLLMYRTLLWWNVAPEQARMVLPQSVYTEWYWSGTLKAFAKMCSLRCKEDTQLETRHVADLIDCEITELYPISWRALRQADLD